MLELDFSRFPVLETERLQLRQLSVHDVPEIFLLRSDIEHNKHINRPKAASFADARAFIDKIAGFEANNQSVMWAISYKSNALLLGTIALWNIDVKKATAEVGYELLPMFQGKGIMQEALQQVLDYGFKKLQFKAIDAHTTPANKNSIALLFKSGFKQTGAIEMEDIYTLKSTGFK